MFHCFVGEKLDKNSVKKMVRKVAETFRLPYFTLTPTFSICPMHGYLAGEHEYCPICDREIEERKAKLGVEKEGKKEVVV